MLNQVVLVGRLTSNLELKETEKGIQVANITLAVQRSFKNEDGEYETDFIDCVLWNSIAENTAQYCRCGDLVGIKGRIQTGSYEAQDGTRRYSTEVIAERITFLSSKKNED